MKEKDKAMARDLSKTDINSMPAREFKATIIKILNGLQKNMEDIRKTLIRNKKGKKTIRQKLKM